MKITVSQLKRLIREAANEAIEETGHDEGREENSAVRYYRAGNPNTSPEVLSILAKDHHQRVRSKVAENPNTPSEVLSILAKDMDKAVRYSVAQNPNTPPEALSILDKAALQEAVAAAFRAGYRKGRTTRR